MLLTTAILMALVAQQPPAPVQPKAKMPAAAGDDVRGYNDTPQIPGQKWKVHDMARPRARKITPGLPLLNEAPPSDAIVLFDGKDLSQWMQLRDGQPPQAPKWKIEDGYMEIVPGTGNLVTKAKFGDCQLHVEWQIPTGSADSGQWRGNSGVELMLRYEVQVIESYQNLTYADGSAGAIYGVWPPLVNPARPEGEWNVFDIFFEAPRFEADKLIKPAYMTVIFNGVLVHHRQELLGARAHRELPRYTPHAPEESLDLQDHERPVRFRNIWIRRLTGYDQQ